MHLLRGEGERGGGGGGGRIGLLKTTKDCEQSLTFFASWRSRACMRGELQGYEE